MSDAADAAITIIDNERTFNRYYNLGGAEQMTYRDMIERLAAYIGKSVRFMSIPAMPLLLGIIGKMYQVSTLNADIARRMNRDISFDNTEAIEDFGYLPGGFLQGDVTV